MKVLLVALSVFLVVVSADDTCEEKCAKCEVLERSECLAGVEKDVECGCCDVCSRFEGQSCDMKDDKAKHGNCGDGLECKNFGKENRCVCIWEEILCGTDNVTYPNLCHLMAAAVREQKQDKLEVGGVGPCEPGAQIVTKPSYIKNTTHNNVVLSCEAIGFPTPKITWLVTRANNKTTILPGDDDHIVTAMRGGPGKFQVTGWMQIENLMKRHEGDYTCIAKNEHREDRSTARLKVAN